MSQHLKVLRDAGLVQERVAGTRHLYRLAPSGLAAVHSSLEELWGSALTRYTAAALEERRRGGEMATAVIPPVVKTIVVPLSHERAFELFFAGMSTWWPRDTHSVSLEETAAIDVDGRPGGRLAERAADGRTSVWGEFLMWDPPLRAVFTWHPGYEDDTATEVEVRFTTEGALTRVDLEHRGWQELGERAKETREGYERGWNLVFAVRYGGAALLEGRRFPAEPTDLARPSSAENYRSLAGAARSRTLTRCAATRASPAALPPWGGPCCRARARTGSLRPSAAARPSLQRVTTGRAAPGRRAGHRAAGTV